MLRPRQVADLRAGVHTLQRLPGQRVPETNAAICRAPAAGQQTVLMRRPRDGLDCGDVIRVSLYWVDASHVPHEQLVVVTAGGQVLVIWGPL